MRAVRDVKVRCAAAVFLWTVYALPLFCPPRAVLAPMPLDPTLLERLFPGVPGWWVVLRLACLLVAVLVTVGLLKCPFSPLAESPGPSAAKHPSASALRAAFAIAALHAFAGVWAIHFNRALQLIYIGALGVPTLVLAASAARQWRLPRCHWPTIAAVGTILTSWLLLAAWPAWRSPWIANAVDAAMTYKGLASTMAPDFNLLTDEVRPSLTALHMVIQGAGLLGERIPLTVPWVQAVNIVWLLVVAAGIARLVRIIVGRAAVPAATAAFLFSPYVMMMPLFLASFFFTPLITVTLLSLAHAVERRGSIVALAALGAVAGIGTTHPVVALVTLAVCGHVAWALLLRPRLHSSPILQPQSLALGVAIALCSFAAVALPAMPSFQRLQESARTYGSGQQQWVGMEAAGLGQVNSRRSEFHLRAGRRGALDVPLGALLVPVAFPRTSLRMLGDALFDPLGTALALLGMAACWRWRQYGWARALLALLTLTLLPGFASSYDRPSITRMSILPVPIALLAAVGFEGLRRGVVPHVRARVTTALVSVVIIVGGWVLYEVVNPRILPRSALNIALAALPGHSGPRAVFIVPGWGDPLESELFATQVPVHPLPTLAYQGPNSLQIASGAPAADLFLWTPGYEEEAGVSRAICERWPGAALYSLFDEGHVGYVFAALPAGPGWQPALAPTQWRMSRCDQPLETEGSRAEAAIAAARELREQGRTAAAVEVLRRAARESFAQPHLFDTLARTLLEVSSDRQGVAEAIGWATRAGEATKFADAEALATLAGAYAAQGRFDDAARFARQAHDTAQQQGDSALAASLDERVAEYERQRGTVDNGDGG